MEYKHLLKEYWDNLGIDNQKSDDMRKARNDFINTQKVMYGRTKFPKKSYCEEFNTTHLITEDFADTTLITGLSTSLDDSKITGGNLVMDVDASTITYENNLNDLDEIAVVLTMTGAQAVTLTCSINNQLGENLYTGIMTYVGDGIYTLSPGLTNQCNFIVTFTVALVDGATSIEVGNIDFKFQKKSMTLPTDLIVPLRAVFTSESGRELASSEIRLSEYTAWIPFRFTNPDGNISEITDPRERYVTEENFLYDRTIGYLFLAEPDGVTLWWKPAIKGKVTLTYSTLPTLAIEEGQFHNAMEAFSDCLVAGATWRALRRKLLETDTKQSEITLNAITISLRDYKSEFNTRMADWVEFTKSRSSATHIEPFDWLSDSEMLRV